MSLMSPRSDAGNVGGEEVNAVAVQVPAGAVVQPVQALAPAEPAFDWWLYRRWVRPEQRARNDTAANCAVDIEDG